MIVKMFNNPNFIGKYKLKNNKICDYLIDYFKNSPNKQDGTVGPIVNKDIKDSIDCLVPVDTESPIINEYLISLKNVCDEYIKEYPFCDHYSAWKIIEDMQIQYYKPGAGFKKFHTERSNANTNRSSRHLVFMTYLNDVTDGGETEFYHQKIKVKPKKGLTLIWPTDWTHTHRGVPSYTQEKYIITGWYSFY